MSFRKGQKVKIKTGRGGRGQTVGKVIGYNEEAGTVSVETTNGKTLNRKIENVEPAN